MKVTFWTMGMWVGCLALLSALTAGAGDWPQWRGPNRDARVTGFEAPTTWPKELTQKWKVEVGNGVATPALVGDKLYVFSREGDNEVLRSLDSATGKELWKKGYEAPEVQGPDGGFGGPRSSPTVVDGKVITFGVSGILTCFDAASGNKLWQKDDVKGVPRFHTSSSPIAIDGLCIAQVGGPKQGAIAAYDLGTGEQKWKWTGSGPGYASPVAMTVNGLKLVVAMTESKLVGLSVADGKLVWETPFPIPGGQNYNAATPIVDGDTLIYGGSNRGVVALKLSKDGDKIVDKELWKNSEKSVLYNTPVLKDGFLYGLTQENQFFCIDAKTGKTVWSAPSGTGGATVAGAPKGEAPKGGGKKGGAPKGGGRGGMRGGVRPGYGSIVDAGSVLIALTPAQQLIAFKPSPKAYSEEARIKVATSVTYAYPILAGNRIFVKDQDSLILWTIQ